MNQNDIIQLAADAANISVKELLSIIRSRRNFEGRCVAAYLMRRMGYNLQDISEALGYADHSGALYCIRTCRKAQTDNKPLYMKMRNAQDLFDERMDNYINKKKIIIR
jgi:chromosomal replication initiation ATPase DnaA